MTDHAPLRVHSPRARDRRCTSGYNPAAPLPALLDMLQLLMGTKLTATKGELTQTQVGSHIVVHSRRHRWFFAEAEVLQYFSHGTEMLRSLLLVPFGTSRCTHKHRRFTGGTRPWANTGSTLRRRLSGVQGALYLLIKNNGKRALTAIAVRVARQKTQPCVLSVSAARETKLTALWFL